ncbi:MAG: tetratricopeptide repeat protein [Ramlibacter sp.]
MNCRHLLVALAAAATLAHAADTPGSNPSAPPPPTAAERMTEARKAIEAKDWRRALSELNAAARVEPRNADVHNLLGYSYRKQATPDITKAFEHYYIALRLDPRHKGAHEYIGQAYLMEKRPEEAQKHLAQLEAICGNKTCEEYVTLAKAMADYKPAAK